MAAALAAMRNETDKHDTCGIAQILRPGGTVRCVKSAETHHLRVYTQRHLISRQNVRGFHASANKVWTFATQ